MPPKSPTTRSVRQQPGLACEECRKRKARCDRAKPQCGSCLMTGRTCIVNYNRPRRGPKKGQIESLYSRLEVLEEQVVDQMDITGPGGLETQQDPQSFPEIHQTTRSGIEDRQESPYLLSCASSNTSDTAERSLLTVRDQLYFDRVHPVAPFLHQRRHASRIEERMRSPKCACLILAMRTVAAAMSAQFRRLADSLYAETNQLLRELDSTEFSPSLDQIQALLLIAHYELLQMEESRAMVTAGRCFRLVQLARLHDTDAYDAEDMLDFVAAEEKRRTFWVAYCFDRFLSSRHKWPLTLQEETIWTRLPVPEIVYQTCQSSDIPMEFLHEAISTSGQRSLSPFAESIVLATLYGRTMNLHRMANLLSVNTTPETNHFWHRYRTLVSTIEKRVHLWTWAFAGPAGLVDPVVAFTHVLGKAALMYVGEVGEAARARTFAVDEASMSSGVQFSHKEHDITDINADVQRPIQAAGDFVQLTRSMGPMNCFKAHPFLPNAISRAAAYLITNRPVSGRAVPFDDEVEELRQMLRDLQTVNNLARGVLRELDSLDARHREKF
ncbi:fungal-specific transcription factor domain-containing protein [Aspergillus oleicola]